MLARQIVEAVDGCTTGALTWLWLYRDIIKFRSEDPSRCSISTDGSFDLPIEVEGIFLSVDGSVQANRFFVERTHPCIHAMTERGGISPSLLLDSYRSVTTIWLAGSILHLPFMDYM